MNNYKFLLGVVVYFVSEKGRPWDAVCCRSSYERGLTRQHRASVEAKLNWITDRLWPNNVVILSPANIGS
jgi:hypothetical protein